MYNPLMTAKILDGKALAGKLRAKMKAKVDGLLAEGKPAPTLAVVLVGNDPASKVYVGHKQKACEEVGMRSVAKLFDASITEENLIAEIQTLNQATDIHGILVQLPLPSHINASKVLSQVSAKKDVDGFHPLNMGKLALRQPDIRPCTPFGIMRLLEETNIDVQGMHAVIVGASNIVGRPMALELLLKGATVTICHRFTKNLQAHVEQAELLIAAVGKPGIIDSEWIKPGAVVIDVGINRLPDGSLQGDIEFDSAKERASAITPVPGGVGPLTVAMLLANTLLSYSKH